MQPGRALWQTTVLCWLAVITSNAKLPDRALALRFANSAPCSGRIYRQFDFWIGDWDAFDMDKPRIAIARNRVESILGGCVLHEDTERQADHEARASPSMTNREKDGTKPG